MAGERKSATGSASAGASDRGAASAARQLESWVADYRPIDGIPDEFIGPDGAPRPHWLKFLGTMARLPAQEMAQRFDSADRHIRDSGISYRVYGEASDRTWPLSRLPLLIDGAEWQTLARGVEQRAELLERVLDDLYGEGRLVGEGAIPAAAVLGSSEFIRPLEGVRPPGGRWLQFYAVDIGRGPDGRWWVLGDRAQAPSGAGYALENRLVFSRAFANLYRDLNVERLAPFFREFRAGLAASAERSDPRICLMTPGPYSETYFEQAYLAKYLGFLLVEGGDLVMRDGHIHVRTIAGLKRADVLWRRVDSRSCDPLELDGGSRLGVPGLVEAIRAGGVSIGNMPGTGVIESRALLGYLPALARRLLGEDLQLPHIATWWCGEPDARRHVLENLDRIAVAAAFNDSAPGLSSGEAQVTQAMPLADREHLARLISQRGVDYVGQEVVQLSTTPALINGKLEPRPFVLRVFAAATPQGWRVMPGGFCRISDELDARAVSMGEGVRSSDVWVTSERPVEMTTLLPRSDSVRIVRKLANLPSRAADNLFWFGRYIERAESTLRLVRCFSNRGIDVDTTSSNARQTRDRLSKLLTAWGATPPNDGETKTVYPPAEIAWRAVSDATLQGSGLALVQGARRAASMIRERLSIDMWQILGELEVQLQPRSIGHTDTELVDQTEACLRTFAALSGLAQENFSRVAGWSFLDMGRRLERGISTCRMARQFADKDATAENLDVLLDIIDSQITYRSRYVFGIALAPVRDMVLLDPYNPRSVAFQTARIAEQLAGLPALRTDGMLEPPHRITTSLLGDLAVEEAAKIDVPRIMGWEQKLYALGEAIEARYFLQGPNAVRTERMTDLA